MANSDNPNPILRRHPAYGKLLGIGVPEEPAEVNPEIPAEEQVEDNSKTDMENNNG